MRNLLLISLLTSTVAAMAGRVVVLGARGQTGKLIVQHLVAGGADVVAVARNAASEKKDGVTWEAGDVTSQESLDKVLHGASAVLFAASASAGWRLGGTNTPYYVDNLGLKNVAEAAVRQKVPRLVVISSGLVTRPTHPIYIMLNTMFGRVMHWKRQGEIAAIAACKESGVTSYTIVRPGGLSSAEGKGPQYITIGQGDQIAGGQISRDDVAKVAVEASKADSAKNTVFEIVGRKQGPREDQKDWSSLFRYLKSNDGSFDRSLYAEPGTEKNEL